MSKIISQSASSHLEHEQVRHSVRSKHIATHEFGCVGLSRHNAKITAVNASWMQHNTVATWYSCNECTHLVHADALPDYELLVDGPLCTAFIHTKGTKMHTTERFCQQKLLTKMTACQMQHSILSYTLQSELPLQPDKLCYSLLHATFTQHPQICKSPIVIPVMRRNLGGPISCLGSVSAPPGHGTC